MKRTVFIIVGLLLLSMMPAPASSLSMDQSLGTADVMFNAWNAGGSLGIRVAIVGDVNNDGYDDIAMADYMNDSMNGNVYLFFGKASGWSTDLADANVTFYTEHAADFLGVPEALGDVNGDGIDDFLIGMPDAEHPLMHTGEAHIYFGKAAGWNRYHNVSHSDATIIGSQMFDMVGGVTAGVGDVNGDGLDDIAVSTYGKNSNEGVVWLYFGKMVGWNNSINLTDADASFHGNEANSFCGYDLAGGDVNGDGYSDIIIAEPGNDFPFPVFNSPGYIHIVFGREDFWQHDVNLTDDANATLMGENYDDHAGWSVAVPGDINGDGFEDILIGSNYNDDTGTGAGKAYLYFGRDTGWTDDFNLSGANASFRGEATGDQAGERVSGAGDVNGDGLADFMIAARYNDEAPLSNQGQTYIFLGKTSGWAVNTSLANADGSWLGEANADWAPDSLSGGGDVNGDVLDDILIGATRGANTGRTYLIHPFTNTRPDDPTDVTIYWDEALTEPATYADQNDTMHVGLTATDLDAVNVNFAQVRMTCEPCDNHGFVLDLRETGVNTGVFVGNFTIKEHTNEMLRAIKGLDGTRVRATSVSNASAFYEINVGGGIRVESLYLANGGDPVLYAERTSYAFKVNVTDSLGHQHLDHVNMSLPLATGRINYTWTYATNSFQETEDPGFFARLDGASFADFPNSNKTTITFRIFFNFSFPDELFHTVSVTAISKDHDVASRMLVDAYRVENDLDFHGTLSVTGRFGRVLHDGDILIPTEPVTFTGLSVVYQGTTAIYPPEGVFDVTAWDDDGNTWVDTASAGAFFHIVAEATNGTDLTEDFVVNITGIPPQCDNTSVAISFKVDGDEVAFSDPAPSPDVWQASRTIDATVNISDTGGSLVNAASIEYRVKPSGGDYGMWTSAGMTGLHPSISASAILALNDGPGNFIQWRATDGIGNMNISGEKTTSPEYNIRVDTVPPELILGWPASANYSRVTEVSFGIRITDFWSQVDGPSIEYTISTDDGGTWSNWKNAGYTGVESVFDCTATETFPEGETNLVKWRASDTRGNGPAVSSDIRIVVNTTAPPPLNRRPDVEMIPDKEVEVGRVLGFTVNASDPDNDTLVFNVADGPNGMVITSAGEVTYAAVIGDVGVRDVTIRVSDGYLHVLVTFRLTVTYEAHSMAVTNPEVLQGKLKGDVKVEGTTTAGSLEVVSMRYRIDDGSYMDAQGIEQWSFVIRTKDLKDGDHRLEVASADSSGSNVSLFFDFTVKNKEPDKPGPGGLGGLLPIMLVLIIVVIIIVIVAVMMRRKKGGPAVAEPQQHPPSSAPPQQQYMYQPGPAQQPPPQQPPQAPPEHYQYQPPPEQPPQYQPPPEQAPEQPQPPPEGHADPTYAPPPPPEQPPPSQPPQQ